MRFNWFARQRVSNDQIYKITCVLRIAFQRRSVHFSFLGRSVSHGTCLKSSGFGTYGTVMLDASTTWHIIRNTCSQDALPPHCIRVHR